MKWREKRVGGSVGAANLLERGYKGTDRPLGKCRETGPKPPSIAHWISDSRLYHLLVLTAGQLWLSIFKAVQGESFHISSDVTATTIMMIPAFSFSSPRYAARL
jgi:hypothetical protein